MDAEEAVAGLVAAGVSLTAALRSVGYAVLMQRIGHKELASLMTDEESYRLLTEGFSKAGIDPLEIQLPFGPQDYLEEVVRSGYHPRARESARRLLDADPIVATGVGRPVRLHDYDPAWPEAYRREARVARHALGGLATAIAHIGSTSVPGLAAKPVVDVLVGLPAFADADSAIAVLCDGGYEYVREAQLGLAGHASVKRGSPSTHRIHLVEHGGELWHRYLAFRDSLREDTQLAAEYERLKRQLAATHQGDRAAYTAGKTPFVERIIAEHDFLAAHDPQAEEEYRWGPRASWCFGSSPSRRTPPTSGTHHVRAGRGPARGCSAGRARSHRLAHPAGRSTRGR
jgi:GrpB-like predicted nucleotidyltransferase (UPF0157 family)